MACLGGLFCSTNHHSICQCHLKIKLLSSLERKLFSSNSIKLECPLKACIAQITGPVQEFNTLPGNKQPCLSKLNWRPPVGFSSLLFIFLIELHFPFPRILLWQLAVFLVDLKMILVTCWTTMFILFWVGKWIRIHEGNVFILFKNLLLKGPC